MVIAVTRGWWAAIGVLLIAGGGGICVLMIRAALSRRIFEHMYGRDSTVRSKLHMRSLTPSEARRGVRLGFGFAGLWGLAAVCIGIGLFVSHVI
jgi:hypothetical protein